MALTSAADDAAAVDCVLASAAALARSGRLAVAPGAAAHHLRLPAWQQRVPGSPVLQARSSDSAASTPEPAPGRPAMSSLMTSPPGKAWASAWRTAAPAQQQHHHQHEQQPARQPQRSVRRCLCLSLGAEPAGAGPPLTPASAGAAIPAPLQAPGAPRAAASAPAPCAHPACDDSSRSRLQQWLAEMELQLHVPPAPHVPPEGLCLAPRGAGPAPLPSLCVGAGSGGASPASLTDSGSGGSGRKRGPQPAGPLPAAGVLAAGAARPPAALLGAAEPCSKRPSLDGARGPALPLLPARCGSGGGGALAAPEPALGSLEALLSLPPPAFSILGVLGGGDCR